MWRVTIRKRGRIEWRTSARKEHEKRISDFDCNDSTVNLMSSPHSRFSPVSALSLSLSTSHITCHSNKVTRESEKKGDKKIKLKRKNNDVVLNDKRQRRKNWNDEGIKEGNSWRSKETENMKKRWRWRLCRPWQTHWIIKIFDSFRWYRAWFFIIFPCHEVSDKANDEKCGKEKRNRKNGKQSE